MERSKTTKADVKALDIVWPSSSSIRDIEQDDDDGSENVGKTMNLRSFKLKVLLRRKFLFLFPSFLNINVLYMFKII